MTTAFSVKTSYYEGPLSLLLDLVEDRKMLVSDVSLSDVADAFLNFISDREVFPLGEAAQFIVIASTLLLLKSRALLPILTLTDDEEGDIKDLELRLRLLQVVRNAARSMALRRARAYFVQGIRVTDPLFVPPHDMTPTALRHAAHAVLASAPRKKVFEEVEVKSVVSLDEMIARLTERVQTAIRLSFKDFAGAGADPREVVVGFLAMLELVKRGFASVTQVGHFEEITIEYTGVADTPRY